MLLASDGLVAPFALFLFFCFAVISRGSGNQPTNNGVGGNYVRLECIMLGYKYILLHVLLCGIAEYFY